MTFDTFEGYVEKHTPTLYWRRAVYFLLGVVSTTLCQALLFVIYIQRKTKNVVQLQKSDEKPLLLDGATDILRYRIR